MSSKISVVTDSLDTKLNKQQRDKNYIYFESDMLQGNFCQGNLTHGIAIFIFKFLC